jgi:hypothetical protein
MHGRALIINPVDDTYLKQSFQVMKGIWYIPFLSRELAQDDQGIEWELDDRSFHEIRGTRWNVSLKRRLEHPETVQEHLLGRS